MHITQGQNEQILMHITALPLALALRLQGVQGCVTKQHIAKWCIDLTWRKTKANKPSRELVTARSTALRNLHQVQLMAVNKTSQQASLFNWQCLPGLNILRKASGDLFVMSSRGKGAFWDSSVQYVYEHDWLHAASP